jgi:hypothetical protein
MAPRTLPALLLVGLLAGGLATGARTDGTSETTDGYESVVRPALLHHDCRPVGFDEVDGERAALVRTPAGRLRVVSLARGRQVYAGQRPGVLVGVCLQR